MVNDKNTGKPRGYAFIEYEEEADMHGKSIEFACLTSYFPSSFRFCCFTAK